MANATLASLRAEAQQRCNQENKTLVSTTEFNRFINLAISELYDLIVTQTPEFYLSSSSFTLSASNIFDLTTLSSPLYKLQGLDYLPSGPNYPVTVRPLNFAERNRYWNQNFAGPYTLWYTPMAPVLVADGDTLDATLNAWAEFIVVTAAIPAAIKEESSNVPELTEQKATQERRIVAAAPTRNGEAQQVADLTSQRRGDSGRRYLLQGSNLSVLGGSALDPWGI